MDKVNRWRERMNQYYNEVSPAQLKQDLELSGFRVLHIGENYTQVRSATSKSMAEVAAAAEINRDEDYTRPARKAPSC
jgi:acetate kinase